MNSLWLKGMGFGLGLALFQTINLLFVIGGHYSDLAHFDVAWYRDIALYGYRVELPLVATLGGGSSIGFFPGFPVWASWVHALLSSVGISHPNVTVTLAGFFCAILLWAQFYVILREKHFSWQVTATLALLISVLPSSFYLVLGYSESLFTVAILGFCYHTNAFFKALDSKRSPWIALGLAALHGFVVTSTRLLGLVVALYPLLKWLERSSGMAAVKARPFRELLGSLLLLLASLLGITSFFAFCHWKWGHWNLYFEANRIGWAGGALPDPLRVFSPWYWAQTFFAGNIGDLLGRFGMVAVIAALAFIAKQERHYPKKSAGSFWALLVMTLLLLGETMVATGLNGLMRYLLPVFFMLITCGVESQWMSAFRSRKISTIQVCVLGAALILHTAEGVLTQRFYLSR